jgi:3-oxoacyl-[acyl-carrier-protein] synthase III
MYSKPLLSGIAYSVGTVTPIDALSEAEGLTSETLMSLRGRGLQNFCHDSRTTPEICLASARDTLEAAALSPGEIAAIVFASSNAEWSIVDEAELLDALHGEGFVKASITGLTLQSCSGFGMALRVASELARAGQSTKNVLVILCGRRRALSRIGPQATTVFSDGAASCIVSANRGEFEILACESQTNTRLDNKQQIVASESPTTSRATVEPPSESLLRQLQAGSQELSEISARAYRASGTTPSQMRALLGTNGSLTYLHLMAQAARLPAEKVYEENVPRYGHVHSCDNLIGLKTFSEENSPSPGDHYLLMAWSPYIVSASVLRYVGPS